MLSLEIAFTPPRNLQTLDGAQVAGHRLMTALLGALIFATTQAALIAAVAWASRYSATSEDDE